MKAGGGRVDLGARVWTPECVGHTLAVLDTLVTRLDTHSGVLDTRGTNCDDVDIAGSGRQAGGGRLHLGASRPESGLDRLIFAAFTRQGCVLHPIERTRNAFVGRNKNLKDLMRAQDLEGKRVAAASISGLVPQHC